MNYASSRHVRRFVGRLAKGERVIECIERLCRRERIRAGAISALGIVRNVVLQNYSADKGYTNSPELSDTFEISAFHGNISTLGDQVIINCTMQMTQLVAGQHIVLGGRLYDAEAISIEFVIEVFEDLILERRLDSRTGLPVWNKIETLAGESISSRAAPPSAPAPAPAPEPEPEPVVEEDPLPVEIPVEQASAPATQTKPKKKPKPEPKPPKAARTSKAARLSGENGAHATAFTGDGTIVTQTSTPQVVRRPTRAATPESGGATWADAVKASDSTTNSKKLGVKKSPQPAKMAMVDDWPDMPDLERGDFLKHPHFGICKIEYVEDDDFVRVRMRGGKVLDIKLEVCEITPAGEHKGKPLYDCKIIRR